MWEKDYQIRLTEKQIAAYKALPRASEDELEAIRNETPEQRAAAVDRMLRKVFFRDMYHPLGRLYRYSNLRRPPKN